MARMAHTRGVRFCAHNWQGGLVTIANAHLFGEADAEPVVVEPQEDHENLAETRLNLSLKGTIAALKQLRRREDIYKNRGIPVASNETQAVA